MSHECFADEIAIDFPSVGRVVERMRDAFLGERVDGDLLRAEVSLSQREAFDGLVLSLDVPVRVTCPHCGGRGETWTEPCDLCRGTGHSLCRHPVGVSTLALGIGAVALIASAGHGGAEQLAAGLTAAAFTTLALIAILWGSVHVIVGVPLRRHKPWSRLVALMLGSVDLLLLPYGTALGVYALWVLLHEDGKKMFIA